MRALVENECHRVESKSQSRRERNVLKGTRNYTLFWLSSLDIPRRYFESWLLVARISSSEISMCAQIVFKKLALRGKDV